MKRCSTCGKSKSVSEFHRNRSTDDGYAGLCKPCETVKKIQGRVNDRAELHALFGSHCARCGTDDRRVLELDHVNGGGNADRTAQRIPRHYGRRYIEFVRDHRAEFQLLCANCHRIKTWEDRERRSGPIPEPQTPAERRAQRSASLSANIKKYWDGLDVEQRSARSRRAMASLSAEELSAKALRAAATVKAKGGRQQHASSAERTERARQAALRVAPALRSERARRAAATRAANRAKRGG